jgi:hypothetical protein
MNITIPSLNSEQTASLTKRAEAAGQTNEEYLHSLLTNAIASWVDTDIRGTALSIEAASRQLPDSARLAFTDEVKALFQQYASGQKT